MSRSRLAVTLRSSSLFAIAFALPLLAQQKTSAPPEFIAWPPISDADRAQKAPMVEKDAGAEILQWRVHVVDEFTGQDLQRVSYNFIRLKIFDEKGKEKAATIDLPYREPGRILDVAGRTIKADGSIVELDKKTVYTRDLVRSGGRSSKVVSFAIPAVEVGAIVEYRWKQSEDDNRFRYLRLHFAREFPIQKVTYFIKPLSSDYVGTDPMLLAHFNCQPSPIERTNDGWNATSLENVPAAHDESYSPSDPNLEPWALLYYRKGGPKDADKYWNEEGKKAYGELKESLKASAEQKTTAAEVVSGATSDEQKIAALVSYVRKTLRNVTESEVTEVERADYFKKMPKDRLRSSAEILKSGIASPYEMNAAFAALAMQIGLDARPALIANHNEIEFSPKALTERYFLDDLAMAVKVNNAWKVFDVSRKYLTPGMLPWEQEGVFALITDPKAPMFITTPPAPPEASSESRTAMLKLSTDGKLTGTTEENYTGHKAEEYRFELAHKSPAQREEWFHDRILRMFPEAEVTGLKVLNVEDPTKPLQVSYQLEAPQFAEVTGKRILFQPNAFRRAQAALFSASERRSPIQFPFAWKEVDQIHIALPEGFTLDSADSPGGLDFGDPGAYKLEIVVKQDKRELVTSREFTFGNKGLLEFKANSYPTLKKIFEEIRLRDTHSLALKGN
jgi:hypothetical protein